MIGALNNEAIALLSIQLMLSKSEMSVANVYLAVPMVFDKKIRNYLKNKNTNIVSLQELVTARSDLFIGFNDKYYGSLIVTTNSIAMGIELGLVDIDGGVARACIKYTEANYEVGKRAREIDAAMNNAVVLLTGNKAGANYSLLRIEV